MQQPPEIEPIPILVRTEEISDRPPGGEEIAVAVRSLCSGQVGGISGIWEEHLNTWPV